MDIKFSAFLFIGACRKSMADDIDVPPLEDLSGVLQKVLHSKSIKTDGSFNRGPVTTSSDSCTVNERISVSVSKLHYLSMSSYESFVRGIAVTYAALFKN